MFALDSGMIWEAKLWRNRLLPVGNLDEYLTRFEELKALLLIRNPTMPDTYFLESFIGGLKPAIESFVRALNPQNLYLWILHGSKRRRFVP